MEIDQDELKRAIAELTECVPESPMPTSHRHLYPVPRPKSSDQAGSKTDTDFCTDPGTSRPQPEPRYEPISVVVAEESDEESFRQAERQWQARTGT